MKPPVRTTYKTLFGGGTAEKTVAVHPAVSLRMPSAGRFATHVGGAHSFKGRVVQLQRRRSDGSWLTITRTRLGSGSTAVFQPRLARGRSVLRIAISPGQAAPGYLAGYSDGLAYRRR